MYIVFKIMIVIIIEDMYENYRLIFKFNVYIVFYSIMDNVFCRYVIFNVYIFVFVIKWRNGVLYFKKKNLNY